MGQEKWKIEKWDKYYYEICKAVANNSKCFSRKIGAVLVKDKIIVSTGYNGPPRDVPRCDERWKIDDSMLPTFGKLLQDGIVSSSDDLRNRCPRQVMGFKSGEAIDLCPAAHAEENTILNAARLGICTKDTKMYMTCGVPCGKCMVKIINAGIEEVIVTELNFYDKLSRYLIDNGTVKLRKFSFLQ